MTDRPLRYCDICGGLDDHPRHVIGVPPDTAIATPPPEFVDGLPPGPPKASVILMDPTTLCRHIDCCAAQGCEVCRASEEVTAGIRGDALSVALENGATKDLNTAGMSVGGI